MNGALQSTLVDADVMHRRVTPRGHGFSYRVFYGLFDLDELPRLGSAFRFFSVGRRNLFSFHAEDHGTGDGALRHFVEETLQANGMKERPARILLLAHPRVLGYAFNPLSIYYCFNDKDELMALLYEVSNTFGGRHVYACLLGPDETRRGASDKEVQKQLYVSPFNPETGHYRLRAAEPGDHVFVHIRYYTEEGLIFLAALQGKRAALTDSALLKRFFTLPFMTLKVIAGIHWEALRLWLKGVPLQKRPQEAAHGLAVKASSRIGAEG